MEGKDGIPLRDGSVVERVVPSPRQQLRAWTAIGMQSVGGGPSTLYLMRRVLIHRNHWVDDREFTQDWMLSKAGPGITLLGLACLLGWRLDGRRGLAIALGGLLLPSAGVALALAVAFASIRDEPIVRDAMAGMAPATIGLTLALIVVFVRSSVRAGRAVVVDLCVVAAAFLVGIAIPTGSIGVILGGALLGWLVLGSTTPPSAHAQGTVSTEQ